MDGFSKQKEKLTKNLKESKVEYESKIIAIKAEYIKECYRLQKEFQSKHLQKEIAHHNHMQELTCMLKLNEEQMATQQLTEMLKLNEQRMTPPLQLQPISRAPMAPATIASPPVVGQPQMARRPPLVHKKSEDDYYYVT